MTETTTLTPHDPEWWPVQMRVDGYEATRRVLAAAFTRWNPPSGYMGLAQALRGAGAEPVVDNHGGGYRLADAMMQRARRAGFLAYDKAAREWREVPR